MYFHCCIKINLIKVWDISEAKYGFKSESCALVYIETATIYSKREDFEKAIDYHKRALGIYFKRTFYNFWLNEDILVELNIETNPEYIANLYSTLSNYQQKNNDLDGYIDSLDKVLYFDYTHKHD